MFQIHSIKVSKDGKKCFLELNSGEIIHLSLDLVAKFKLTKAKSLSKEELDIILEEQKIIDAKNVALNFISYKPRTKSQTIQRLEKEKFSHKIIEKVISFLKEFGYLDDFKYAKDYVNYAIFSKKQSIRKIQNDLFSKGIAKEIIEQVLKEVVTYESEFENALILAKKRMKSLSQANKKKNVHQYIGQFLFRKGFDWETIGRVLEHLKSEMDLHD